MRSRRIVDPYHEVVDRVRVWVEVKVTSLVISLHLNSAVYKTTCAIESATGIVHMICRCRLLLNNRETQHALRKSPRVWRLARVREHTTKGLSPLGSGLSN